MPSVAWAMKYIWKHILFKVRSLANENRYLLCKVNDLFILSMSTEVYNLDILLGMGVWTWDQGSNLTLLDLSGRWFPGAIWKVPQNHTTGWPKTYKWNWVDRAIQKPSTAKVTRALQVIVTEGLSKRTDHTRLCALCQLSSAHHSCNINQRWVLWIEFVSIIHVG